MVYLFLLIAWGELFPSFMKKNLYYKLGDTGHMFTRFQEANTKRNIDILCLGSSLSYRGFDTRIFKAMDIECFNFGSSSQTPIQSHLLAKRYLKQLNPKLVLFQVDPEAFSADGVESSLDIIANEPNDRYSFFMTLKILNLKTINAFIYGCYRDLFNRNKKFNEEQVKNGDSYIKGGFVEKELAYAQKSKIPKYNFEFDKKQKSSFEALLRLFKDQGTDCYLIYPPVTSYAYKSCSNIEVFDSTMYSYGHFLDFNQQLELSDSLDFYDGYHLNQNGVNKFNKSLLKIIDFQSN